MDVVKYKELQEMLGGDFPEDFKAAVDAAIRIMPPGWEVFAISREVTLRWGYDIRLRFTWPNDVRWDRGDVEIQGCFLKEHDGNLSTEHITLSRISYNESVELGQYVATKGQFWTLDDDEVPVAPIDRISPAGDQKGAA